MSAMDYSSVAQWYDAYATIDVDIPFYLREIDTGRDRVLELACGTGRVSLPLLRAGVSLTCVDFSSEMLDVLHNKLKAEGLQADVHCQDVRELDLDQRFNLVIMPFTSFQELADPEHQLKTLQAIRPHLSDGGRFLCALQNPSARLANVDGRLRLVGKSRMENGETMLLWSLENYDAATHMVSGIQTWEVFDANGLMITKHMLEITFSLPSREDFTSLCDNAGLCVQAAYGDFDHSDYNKQHSPYMIFDCVRSM